MAAAAPEPALPLPAGRVRVGSRSAITSPVGEPRLDHDAPRRRGAELDRHRLEAGFAASGRRRSCRRDRTPPGAAPRARPPDRARASRCTRWPGFITSRSVLSSSTTTAKYCTGEPGSRGCASLSTSRILPVNVRSGRASIDDLGRLLLGEPGAVDLEHEHLGLHRVEQRDLADLLARPQRLRRASAARRASCAAARRCRRAARRSASPRARSSRA